MLLSLLPLWRLLTVVSRLFPTARFRPTDFADRPNLFFFLIVFAFASFMSLSRCIKIEFPELKAPPFTLEHKGSRGLFRKSKFVVLICSFSRAGFWLGFGLGGGAGWGQGAPSAALCLLSESAREGSQPSSSPSALRASRSMIWVATSEPTRCVFAGCAMCASSCTTAISLYTRNSFS